MADKIIGIMWHSRNISHEAHLKTRGAGSFAVHDATGSFYPAIICLSDRLAEVYMGRGNSIKDIPFMTNKGTSSIADTLETHMKLIEKARNTDIDKDDSVLQNIIDEILSLYLQTLFKLHSLK